MQWSYLGQAVSCQVEEAYLRRRSPKLLCGLVLTFIEVLLGHLHDGTDHSNSARCVRLCSTGGRDQVPCAQVA